MEGEKRLNPKMDANRNRIIGALKYAQTLAKDPELKRILNAALQSFLSYDLEVQAAIEYMHQLALRGAEFPGDWVGRPADDFQDYYDDDYVFRKGKPDNPDKPNDAPPTK